MKKISTLLCLLVVTIVGQAQITISSVDMPTPTQPFGIRSTPISVTPAPTSGSNQTWDASGLPPTAVGTTGYLPETDAFFTSQGVDVYRKVTKQFNTVFSYDYFQEFDFNANGVDDKGVYAEPQGFDLASFTGSILDSLKIPELLASHLPTIQVGHPIVNDLSTSH
jgi:hypothetical protein